MTIAPKWMAKLPQQQVGAFPGGDVDLVDLRDCRYVGATQARAMETQRPEIVNVALERCDVAGFLGEQGRAERVLLQSTRLRGVIWANGLVRDVHFVDVVALETSFRFSELVRVHFRDCKLAGIDFTRSTFADVTFDNCELVGATFDAARVTDSVRFERCDLTGCSGVEALRGASIHSDDLMSLAPSMARALGIRVEQS